MTVNGKSYHRDPGARIMPIHRPVIRGTTYASVDFCEACGKRCYSVIRRGGSWYWRHEPDTFWTSR